jgi:hypothetical protein
MTDIARGAIYKARAESMRAETKNPAEAGFFMVR